MKDAHVTYIKSYDYHMRKVFKNGTSKICGRQALKNLKGYGLLSAIYVNFLRRLGIKVTATDI